MNEENLNKAVEAFLSPERTKSYREIAKEYGVPVSTVQDRVNGGNSREEAYKNNQVLSKYEEKFLEGYLIFFAQQNTPLSRMATRKLAGSLKSNWDSKVTPRPLSNNWLLGFLKRCKYLKVNEEHQLGIPRVQENAGDLISQFFMLYTDYVDTCNILPDDIWNIDEAVFKIENSTGNSQYLAPNNGSSVDSNDTSELVTVLEIISRTGKVGKPFFVYKGVHHMESWFPGVITEKYDCTTFSSEVMNDFILNEWVSDHFPGFEDKWTLLLTHGHLSPISDQVIATLISKRIIPLYFPSHMNSVLQPLDRPCFDHATVPDRREIPHNFCVGLSPTQTRFFETYMGIRKEVYSSKTIIKGWRRCGLLENNPDVALDKYKRQIHHDSVTPEDPVQEESVIEPEEGEVSTIEPPKKRTKRNRGLENTGESSLLETRAALMEANRKLQLEVKRVRRAEAGALTLLGIMKTKLEQYENESGEEKREN